MIPHAEVIQSACNIIPMMNGHANTDTTTGITPSKNKLKNDNSDFINTNNKFGVNSIFLTPFLIQNNMWQAILHLVCKDPMYSGTALFHSKTDNTKQIGKYDGGILWIIQLYLYF